MKIEASLLRPFFDITGEIDGCVQANLTGTLEVPEIKAHVPSIPVDLAVKVKVFGIPMVKAKISGSVGGTVVTVSFQKPVAFAADACVKGIARINPKKPVIADCCEEYRVEPCKCDECR